MDYLIINGDMRIPYPNDFTMQKKVNKVAEIQTMAGDVIADKNGWFYESQTLSWDTLFDNDLNTLLSLTNADSFTIQFTDLDGTTRIEEAVFESRINVKTPIKRNGQIVWTGIQVAVSFPRCHHD